MKQDEMNDAIRLACSHNLGVLDSSFMCQSLSVLSPKKPLCVPEGDTVESVISILRENKVGCVLVTDKAGKLVGIFSERDCVLKVTQDYNRIIKEPVSRVMTKEPVTQPPDGTIAFTLNLMSSGGFRHIPIVDSDMIPTGLVSVKDVVDYIVSRFIEDVMAFPTE